MRVKHILAAREKLPMNHLPKIGSSVRMLRDTGAVKPHPLKDHIATVTTTYPGYTFHDDDGTLIVVPDAFAVLFDVPTGFHGPNGPGYGLCLHCDGDNWKPA